MVGAIQNRLTINTIATRKTRIGETNKARNTVNSRVRALTHTKIRGVMEENQSSNDRVEEKDGIQIVGGESVERTCYFCRVSLRVVSAVNTDPP